MFWLFVGLSVVNSVVLLLFFNFYLFDIGFNWFMMECLCLVLLSRVFDLIYEFGLDVLVCLLV